MRVFCESAPIECFSSPGCCGMYCQSRNCSAAVQSCPALFVAAVPAAVELLIRSLLPACRSTEANKYTQQELLLMKTQDAKYLGLKSRTEAAVSNCCARLALLPPSLQIW
eukprot:GHRQ01039288.1.p1 GENE.GHRQ01039288.1~~GHRQ01039288.1.p1  ORF type:complete len:110 (-),score=22.16 GHRQ01039288.1:255-584(-)